MNEKFSGQGQPKDWGRKYIKVKAKANSNDSLPIPPEGVFRNEIRETVIHLD